MGKTAISHAISLGLLSCKTFRDCSLGASGRHLIAAVSRLLSFHALCVPQVSLSGIIRHSFLSLDPSTQQRFVNIHNPTVQTGVTAGASTQKLGAKNKQKKGGDRPSKSHEPRKKGDRKSEEEADDAVASEEDGLRDCQGCT
jgi:hypothetical protein